MEAKGDLATCLNRLVNGGDQLQTASSLQPVDELLGGVEARPQGLAPALHLAPAALKELRRELVAALLPQLERGPSRAITGDGAACASAKSAPNSCAVIQ